MNNESANSFFGLNWLELFLILNLVGIVLIAATAWLIWRSFSLSIDGQVATGVVSRLTEDDPAEFFTDISPVVEFEANGQPYSVRIQNSYPWWDRYLRFSVGRQVALRYDPVHPENVAIDSWLDLWVEPLTLGIFTGFFVIIVNMVMLRWRFGRNKREPA